MATQAGGNGGGGASGGRGGDGFNPGFNPGFNLGFGGRGRGGYNRGHGRGYGYGGGCGRGGYGGYAQYMGYNSYGGYNRGRGRGYVYGGGQYGGRGRGGDMEGIGSITGTCKPHHPSWRTQHMLHQSWGRQYMWLPFSIMGVLLFTMKERSRCLAHNRLIKVG